ncbi:MAG: zinc ribbon domain-containing protein, partial [Pseudobutyrivibrio sp.]|nr:zinc ribbon domain-containing protein [Pseudobutyrivibrio sp.]
MNCSKCGHEITGNIKFCPKCGTPVEAAPEATDTPVEEVVETPEVEAAPETPVVEEAPEAEAPAAPETEESASVFGDSTEPLFERNEGSIFEDAPVAENDVLGDAPTEELTPD